MNENENNYEKACKFLEMMKNRYDAIWCNLNVTPDNNKKKEYLERLGYSDRLSVEYVNGVYDGINECGLYSIVMEFVNKLGIELQRINPQSKGEIRRKLGLDYDYFAGIFDAIIEKQKLQSSDTSEKNNQGDKGDEGKEDDEFVQ